MRTGSKLKSRVFFTLFTLFTLIIGVAFFFLPKYLETKKKELLRSERMSGEIFFIAAEEFSKRWEFGDFENKSKNKIYKNQRCSPLYLEEYFFNEKNPRSIEIDYEGKIFHLPTSEEQSSQPCFEPRLQHSQGLCS